MHICYKCNDTVYVCTYVINAIMFDEMSFTMYFKQNKSITTPTERHAHMLILFAGLEILWQPY